MSQCICKEGASSNLKEQNSNLVLVKATRLEIFRCVVLSKAAGLEEFWQLEVVAQYPLHGTVQDLAVLKSRSPATKRDAIVLSFRDAKLVVLEWDPAAYCIRSSSMHSLESDTVLTEGRRLFPMPPRVVADPQGRCAALAAYQHHLAILPATGGDLFDDLLHDADSVKTAAAAPGGIAPAIAASSAAAVAAPTAASLGNSYSLNLAKLVGVREVRDLVFLHGYSQPVLLLLHESDPSAPGMYRDRKDTCCITALLLNTVTKRHATIWSAKDLPSDSFRLLPCPNGGALVLSQNLVMYHTQGSSCVMAVNSHAFPGDAPARMEFNPLIEEPAATAARFARQYANNIHPESSALAARNAPKAPGLEVELDGAHACWLSGTSCLLGLRTGALLMVQLSFLGEKAARLQVTSAGAAPQASALCTVSSQLLFLGSWTGGSLLIRYAPEAAGRRVDVAADGGGGAGDEPAAKRRRLDGLDASRATTGGAPPGEESADEEDELFGGRSSSGAAPAGVSKFSFKVEDSLPDFGPVRDMVVAEHSSAMSLDASGKEQPRGGHDLVAAVGSGATGALAVLRRGLVSDVITEVPLPGVTGAWAVRYRPVEEVGLEEGPDAGAPNDALDANEQQQQQPTKQDDKPGSQDPPLAHHAYLLLSLSGGSTMVLATGEELQEVTETSQFATETVTVAAGNLWDDSCICQVYHTGVRLMAGPEMLQDVQLHELIGPQAGGPVTIVAASIQDPYILLQLSTGQALLLLGDRDIESVTILPAATPVLMEGGAGGSSGRLQPGYRVTVACLYRDDGGWLSSALLRAAAAVEKAATSDGAPDVGGDVSVNDGPADGSAAGGAAPADRRDEEADELFGRDPDSPSRGHGGDGAESHNQSDAAAQADGNAGAVAAPAACYCAVARANGSLELYNLPDMELIFRHTNLVDGGATLQSASANDGSAATATPVVVNELRLESFVTPGARGAPSAPLLVALLSDGVLLVYKAFQPPQQPLAFTRLPLDVPFGLGQPPQPPQPQQRQASRGRIVRFDRTGQAVPYCGLFICGEQPLWLVAGRGTLQPHPMTVEGPVGAMTPFHNVNCEKGFILSADSGELKICQFPGRLRLDGPLVYQTVPLRGTPHRLAWYPEARLHAVLTSRQVPYRPRLPEEQGGDAHGAAAYAAADVAHKARGREEGHELLLLRPGTWTVAWRHLLLPDEVGLSLRAVHLHSTESSSTEPLIVAGTSFSLGEDYPSMGRVVVVRVSPQHNGSAAAPGVKPVAAAVAAQREFQGPVTHVSDFKGFLLVAVGHKLELHTWTGTSLVKSAFFDSPLLITSVNAVKDFILVGDVHKSVTFVRYVEAGRQLVPLGKGYDHVDVWASEFLINRAKLNFLLSDGSASLRVMEYNAADPDSWAGKKLLLRGAHHLGSHATRFLQVRMPERAAAAAAASRASKVPRRYAALYGTLDGGYGLVVPLADTATADRLTRLQEVMTYQVAHIAGLNPKAFRRRYALTPKAAGGGEAHSKPPSASCVFDGDLLWAFVRLSASQQGRIAALAGSTRAELLHDMAELSHGMGVL